MNFPLPSSDLAGPLALCREVPALQVRIFVLEGVEPDTPAVPMFTVLVTPLVVAPVPRPRVEAAAELPTVTLVAEKVVVFWNVWATPC